MAQFGDKARVEVAANAANQHYPNREIISLNVDALGEIGGGIHCATQQMPAL
ncbi:MAG: agmatine deiminase family protein [Pseudomonadota bacterium]